MFFFYIYHHNICNRILLLSQRARSIGKQLNNQYFLKPLYLIRTQFVSKCSFEVFLNVSRRTCHNCTSNFGCFFFISIYVIPDFFNYAKVSTLLFFYRNSCDFAQTTNLWFNLLFFVVALFLQFWHEALDFVTREKNLQQ